MLTEDGKTMAEEARDSAQMLGIVMTVGALEVAALLYWLL